MFQIVNDHCGFCDTIQLSMVGFDPGPCHNVTVRALDVCTISCVLCRLLHSKVSLDSRAALARDPLASTSALVRWQAWVIRCLLPYLHWPHYRCQLAAQRSTQLVNQLGLALASQQLNLQRTMEQHILVQPSLCSQTCRQIIKLKMFCLLREFCIVPGSNFRNIFRTSELRGLNRLSISWGENSRKCWFSTA